MVILHTGSALTWRFDRTSTLPRRYLDVAWTCSYSALTMRTRDILRVNHDMMNAAFRRTVNGSEPGFLPIGFELGLY